MQIKFKDFLFEICENKIYLLKYGNYINLNKCGFLDIQISGENKDTHLGIKMINSSEGKRLIYVSHQQTDNRLEIVQKSELIETKTVFLAYTDTSTIRIYTEVKNISLREIVIEEVSSFVGVFLGENSVENSKNLLFYRFIQSHHAECQPRKQSFYEYGLHRGNIESQKRISFANIGSWSTKEELPQGIIENSKTNDFLMFQIESNSSWYYEIGDKSGEYYLYCGGANLPFGGWSKLLKTKETYCTPNVAVSLGNSLNEVIGDYPGVRLGLLDEVYPAGDEVVLIYEVTGKVVNPGGLPIQSGVAVFNVETVYNVYRAIKKQTPVVDKLVSVVAEVNKPVTVRVPLGCTIQEVVDLAGGTTTKNAVYFVGGPMMGNIGTGSQPVTKTTNAVLVLPEDHLIINKKKRKASIDMKRAAASCCQCTMCTDLCPRNRLGHPIEPHKFMRAATCKDLQDPNIFVNTMFCSSCGLCEMYSCMQGLSPRSLMADYKAGLRQAGLKPPQGVIPAPVGEEREYRKVPMERLMARLDLTKYDKEAPLDDEVVDIKKVRIMLSQHIGAPATAVVKVGDKVERGQVVGAAGNGLSVAIHASISGTVTEVSDRYVVIEK